MFVPTNAHNRASDKLLAAASALMISGIMMAIAILPASHGNLANPLALAVMA